MPEVSIITSITITNIHFFGTHHFNERTVESFDSPSDLLRDKNSINEEAP